MTVMAKIKKFSTSLKSFEKFQSLLIDFSMKNLNKSMIKIKIAEIIPNFPISSAIFYSLFCNGVGADSSWINNALILPIQDWSPTTKIIIFPSPVSTRVPLIKTGDGI